MLCDFDEAIAREELKPMSQRELSCVWKTRMEISGNMLMLMWSNVSNGPGQALDFLALWLESRAPKSYQGSPFMFIYMYI